MDLERRLKVGGKSKNFVLPDQTEKEFILKKFKGKRVLLSFHPLAWTSVCSEQMKSLEKNGPAFDSLNTIAVGVSVDTVPSKKAWAESLGIKNTRLLSDFWPHGRVAKAYGLFLKDRGTSARANVIINENGVICFFKVYPIDKLPDIEEIMAFIKNMPSVARKTARRR